jgi:hypothetical protein
MDAVSEEDKRSAKLTPSERTYVWTSCKVQSHTPVSYLRRLLGDNIEY